MKQRKKKSTSPAMKTYGIRLNATIANYFTKLAKANHIPTEDYLCELIEAIYASAYAPDGLGKVML